MRKASLLGQSVDNVVAQIAAVFRGAFVGNRGRMELFERAVTWPARMLQLFLPGCTRAPRAESLWSRSVMDQFEPRVLLSALPLYWDADTSTPGLQAGEAVWSSGTGNWATSPDTTWYTNWSDDHVAVFQATGNSTLTISGTVRPAAVVFSGTGSVTIAGGTLQLGSPEYTQPTVTAQQSATISSAIVGNYGLIKDGADTLTLTGINTYSGGTTIAEGTLSIQANTALGNSTGAVTLAHGAVLTNNNLNVSLPGTRGIILNSGGGTLTASWGRDFTLAGPITGTGSLTISRANPSGSGHLILTGAGTFTGPTVVASSGYLRLDGGDNRLPVATSLTVDGCLDLKRNQRVDSLAGAGLVKTSSSNASPYRTLTVSGAGISVFDGTFQDGGTGYTKFTLAKSGTGTLILTANSPSTGGVKVNQGTLQLGLGGTTGMLPGNWLVNGVLALDRAGAYSYSGSISGSGTVAKLDSGTLTLGGTSSHSGLIQVAGGSLVLTGTTAAGVAVANGAALAGTGSTTGTITLDNGGLLQPGRWGISPLGTGGLNLASAGSFKVDLAAGLGQTSVTGTVSLNQAILSLAASPVVRPVGHLTLMAASAGTVIQGTFANMPEGSLVTLNGYSYRLTYQGGASGQDVVLEALPLASASDGQVTLRWGFEPGALAYNVYRATSPDGIWTLANTDGPVTVTRWNDSGLANGTTYYYRVGAIFGTGEGPLSPLVSATPVPVPVAPETPTVQVTLSSVALTWPAVGGTAHYYVSRATNPTGSFVRLNGAPTNLTSYIDSSPKTIGQSYYYRVTSVTAAGESQPSLVAQADILGRPAAPDHVEVLSCDGQVQLTWPSVAPTATYQVYRSLSSESGFVLLTSSPLTNTSFLDTGLSNGTSYYYKIIAHTTGGDSPDSAVLPAQPLATPTALVATAQGACVHLSWTGGAGSTGYLIYRSLESGGGHSRLNAVPVTGTTFIDSDLPDLNGTDLYYVVMAVNSTGESWFSGEVSARPVARPAVLNAGPMDGQVNLTWSESFGATAYQIWMVSPGAPVLLDTLDDIGFVASNLTNGTSYGFMIRAINSSGQSADSEIATCTPVAPPAAPAGVTAAAGDAMITVTWNVTEEAESYALYRSTNGGDFVLIATEVPGGSYTDSDLLAGAYAYHVYAVNAGGLSPASDLAGASVLLPAVPKNLVASAGTGQVTLTWTASCNATGYLVYRATDPAGPYTLLTDVDPWTTLSFTDTTVTNGTGYCYQVAAVNADGSSGLSAVWTAQPMDAPTNLVLTGGDEVVTLSWDPVAGATGYKVWRSVDGQPFAQVNYEPLTDTNWTDWDVLNATTYRYQIQAFNDSGTSDFSATLAATPWSIPQDLVVVVGDSTLTLSWATLADADGYQVYRATLPEGPFTLLSGNLAVTTFTDTTVTNRTSYYYQITALHGTSESQPGSTVAAIPVAVPANPVVTASAQAPQVVLTWDAVPDAAGYQVYRSLTSGSGYVKLEGALVSDPTFADAGLTPQTTYYYQVTAINATGESLFSTEVSVTPELPPAPTGLSLAPADGQLTLTWTPGAGSTSFDVWRSEAAGGPYAQLTGSPVTATTWTDLGRTNGTRYYYVVTANNAAGASSYSPEATGAAFKTPATLTVTAGDAQAELAWSEADGAEAYNVYRQTAGTGDFVKVNGYLLPIPEFLDTDLTNATSYTYRITAVHGSLESLWSPEVTVTPRVRPQTPTDLTLSVADNSLTLTWTAAAAAAGYNLYRSTVSGAGYERLNTDPITSPTFTDTAVVNGTLYYYLLTAVNVGGESDPTAEASAAPAAALPAGFLRADIGSGTGLASANSGTWTLTSSGYDITGTSDAFEYAYTPAYGDITLTARVASQTGSSPAAKAGLLLRDSLTDDARLAGIFRSAGGTLYFLSRASAGADLVTQTGPTIPGPLYLKLTRTGNSVQGSYSSDGVTWQSLPASSLTLSPTLTAGLTVCARSTDGSDAAAILDGLTLTQAPAAPTLVHCDARDGQVTLGWEPSLTATSYNIYRKTASDTAYGLPLASVPGSATSYLDTTVVNGTTYNYVIRSVSTQEGLPSAATTAQPVANLGTWTISAIGSPALAGTAQHLEDTWNLTAAGTGLGLTSDQLTLVGGSLAGDGILMTQLASAPTAAGARAGVMFRESTAVGSAMVALVLGPGGLTWAYRASTGGATVTTVAAGMAAPQWLAIIRRGTNFTGAVSSDGVTWSTAGSVNLTLASTLNAGLVLASGDSNASVAASFNFAQTAPLTQSAPDHLFAYGISGSHMRISWNYPDYGAVSAVVINRSTNGGALVPVATLAPGTTFYDDRDVLPQQNYDYTVSLVTPLVTMTSELDPSTPADEVGWYQVTLGERHHTPQAAITILNPGSDPNNYDKLWADSGWVYAESWVDAVLKAVHGEVRSPYYKGPWPESYEFNPDNVGVGGNNLKIEDPWHPYYLTNFFHSRNNPDEVLQGIYIGLEDIYERNEEDLDHDDTYWDVTVVKRQFLVVNDGDRQQIGVPDFNNGFNPHGSTPDMGVQPTNQNPHDRFTAVNLTLPDWVDLSATSNVKMKLEYGASDPRLVTGSPTQGWQPDTAGHMRLWTADGNVPRGSLAFPNGNYLKPKIYTRQDLADLGFSETNRTVTLYLEAVRKSQKADDLSLKVSVDNNGTETAFTPVLNWKITALEAAPLAYGDGATQLLGSATGSDGGNPGALRYLGPVRLDDGSVAVTSTDFVSNGYGFAYGPERTWTDELAFTLNNGWAMNGNNVVMSNLPYLLDAGSSIVVIVGGRAAEYFDHKPDGSGYVARFFVQDKLEARGQGYVLTDSLGNQIEFYGFDYSLDHGGQIQGRFRTYTSGGGVTISTQYEHHKDEAKLIPDFMRLSSLQRQGQTWLFQYAADRFEKPGQVKSIELVGVEKVEYTYYQQDIKDRFDHVVDADPNKEDDKYGQDGDLKSTRIKYLFVPGQANGVLVDQYYYRYDPSNGQLRRALGGDAAQRLFAKVVKSLPPQADQNDFDDGRLDRLSDSDMATYSDVSVTYNGNGTVDVLQLNGAGNVANGTPSKEDAMVVATMGAYSFSFDDQEHTGINDWRYHTVVTGPDGTSHTVYLNFAGEVMLERIKPSGATAVYETLHKYDGQGRGLATVHPSGFAQSPTEDQINTVDFSPKLSYEFLQKSTGFIEVATYGDGSANVPLGFLAAQEVQRGAQGTKTKLSEYTYSPHSAEGATVYFPYQIFTHPATTGSSGNSGRVETRFEYANWNHSQPGQVVTHLPKVSEAQHGDNADDTTVRVFDQWGWLKMATDAAGKSTETDRNATTGALEKTVVDVGGLKLTTEMKDLDPLGRARSITGPNGHTATYQYLDGAALRSVSVVEPDRVPHVTKFDRRLGRTIDAQGPGAATSGGDLSSLSVTSQDIAGRTIFVDRYFKIYEKTLTLPGINIKEGAWGTANNPSDPDSGYYYRTTYAYDTGGRQYLTTDPSGAVTKTIFDGLGRDTEVQVGKAAAALVTAIQKTYDHPDGLLTSVTLKPGFGQPDRLTTYFYDWRDNLIATKNSVAISYHVLDNLGRTLSDRTYTSAGGGLGDTDSDGVPDTPAAASLRAQIDTSYDARGRVYSVRQYDVNQTTGAVGGSVATHTWFDKAGNVMAVWSPGGLWTKSSYDGAGRATTISVTDGAAGTSYAAARSTANDHVLHSQTNDYNELGNVVRMVTYDRYHDFSGIGALSPTNARVSYVTNYYNNLGQLMATVDYGTNPGKDAPPAPTATDHPPARSDTVLVKEFVYDYNGIIIKTTDPRGLSTTTVNDALGRVVIKMEGSSGVSNQTRLAQYKYDGLGHQVLVTAYNVEPGYFGRPGTPQTTAAVTRYQYAIGTLNSDALAEVTYPAWTGGSFTHPDKDIFVVDTLGEMVQKTMTNKVVHKYAYDSNGRQTSDDANVDEATNTIDKSVLKMVYEYDTLNRPTLLRSEGKLPDGTRTVQNEIRRAYNGLGQLICEVQSALGRTESVVYDYDVNDSSNYSRLKTITYPDGWKLQYGYSTLPNDVPGLNDRISRVSFLAEESSGEHLEDYRYLGLSEIVQRGHMVGSSFIGLSYMTPTAGTTGEAGDKYISLDRFGRVVMQRWTSQTQFVDNRTYGYDADSNRLYMLNLANDKLSEVYGTGTLPSYDALNRIQGFIRGKFTASPTVGPVGHWELIDVATRRNYYWDSQDTLVAYGPYATRNGTPTGDLLPGVAVSHDSPYGSVYDAWNRLVICNYDSVKYAYDALGRKLVAKQKAIGTLNTPNGGAILYSETETKAFVYDMNGQVIQENKTTQISTPPAEPKVVPDIRTRYVWSKDARGALLLRDQQSVTNGAYSRIYAITDAAGSVVAIATRPGVVLERYTYDPFGELLDVRSANWNVIVHKLDAFVRESVLQYIHDELYRGSQYNWDILFQSRRRDGAVDLYDLHGASFAPQRNGMIVPQTHIETWGEAVGNWFSNNGKSLLIGGVSVLVGVGMSFLTTPVGGFAAGLATFAALSMADRMSQGQSVEDAWVGGWGDTLGHGGIFTGLTGSDLGTLDDLHLSDGQRAFVGGMGVLQLVLSVTGLRAAALATSAKTAASSAAGRSLGTIYHVTDDFEQVVVSGRAWGQTEGSVYGMRTANASRLRTMMDMPIRDPGTVIFEGQAASLFRPHPIEGPYSLLKRLLGQQKAGFGDVVFDMSTATRNGNVLIVRNASLGLHVGRSELWLATRLWGRRTLDLGLTAGIATAGGSYVYSKMRE